MKVTIPTISVLFLMASSFVNAQSLNADIQQCVEIKDNLARLTCYDKIGEAFKKDVVEEKGQAVSQNEVTISQTEAKQQTVSEIAVPAATAPSPSLSTAPVVEPKAETVTSTKSIELSSKEQVAIFGKEHEQDYNKLEDLIVVIASVKSNMHGKRRFIFENGQSWHQIDTDKKGKYSVGDTVTIKRGMLSSFSLHKAGSNRSLKVKRVK